MTIRSAATQRLLARTHFWNNQKQWCRVLALQDSHWSVATGLTTRGWEDVGDVLSISLLSDSATVGRDLIRIEWEGYKRSESDELYHAVWETIEGTTILASPVTGLIESVADPSMDEDDTLVTIVCNKTDLLDAAVSWQPTPEKDDNGGIFSD